MSYEQSPAYFPQDLPKDGKKRIFIEKHYEKQRDREAQLGRLRRLGYAEDKKYSNEDADCLVIDESIINERAKSRERHTASMLLSNAPAGVSGEETGLSKTTVRGPQNPESFFGESDDE